MKKLYKILSVVSLLFILEFILKLFVKQSTIKKGDILKTKLKKTKTIIRKTKTYKTVLTTKEENDINNASFFELVDRLKNK